MSKTGAGAKRLEWQGITSIVLASALVAVLALGAWLLAIVSQQSTALVATKGKVSSLTYDLARARNNADSLSAQLKSSSSDLATAKQQAAACAIASTLYASALGDVAKAVQVGLNSSAATVYLTNARVAQDAANSAGCVLTQDSQ